jgi:bacterioferritin
MPKLVVGKDVKSQFQNDLALEKNAVAEYNVVIATCRKAGDNASADMLQVILADEEEHVDFLEEQLSLINAVGIQNYLAQQV